MDVDSLLKSYEINTDERPAHELHFYCPSCGTFYTEETAYRSKLEITEAGRIKETHYCNCHGRESTLKDAHEVGCSTPAMDWEREHLERILYRIESKSRDIRKLLEGRYN